jgi:hypothetical protein
VTLPRLHLASGITQQDIGSSLKQLHLREQANDPSS